MNLFFDLRLRYFVDTPGLESAITNLTFKSGDGEEIVLQFGRSPSANGPASVVQAPDWTPESLSATGSIKIGIKAAGDYSDGDLLASLDTFVHDAENDTYTGSLDLNTEAINALLERDDEDDSNDVAAIEDALFEMTFKTASGQPDRSSIEDILTLIKHDVLSGTEGTPTNAGDPDSYALIANTVQYLPSITGTTGGTASDLDSIATTTATVGGLYKFVDSSTGYARTYELIAGTDAESSPDIIRPDDYATTTNEKIYVLRDSAAGSGISELSEDISPEAGGILSMAGNQFRESIGADVASATTTTTGNDGNTFTITGTTAITALGAKAVGTVERHIYAGALTLTHHATDLICLTGANITTAAGDVATWLEYASGDWRMIDYSRADGSALSAGSGGLGAVSEDASPEAGGVFSMDEYQFQEAIGASVASASTTTTGTDGNTFTITGTTTITALGAKPIGTVERHIYDGILTLTHHATDLKLITGANITTAAGDIATWQSYASGDWRMIDYTRADGSALVTSPPTIDDGSLTLEKLEDIAASRLIGRKTSTGAPEELTVSELLDFIGSAAQGDILYRGASTWARLAKGSYGETLTQGASTPFWGHGRSQIVTATSSATASTSATIPLDTSEPTNTEGDSLFSGLLITPKSTSSKIVIDVFIPRVSTSTATTLVALALFKDSETSARQTSVWQNAGGATYRGSMTLRYVYSNSSTASQTWRVRWGVNAESATIDGEFGSASLRTFTVTEI